MSNYWTNMNFNFWTYNIQINQFDCNKLIKNTNYISTK